MVLGLERDKIRRELRKIVELLNLYCDMTPESWNSSLLDNGSLGMFLRQKTGLWKIRTVATKLTQVSAATNKQRKIQELFRNSDLYSVRPRDIKGGVVGGDEKGSLKTETVKYRREIQGTRTRERLRWGGPAAYTKDRPVLSSERAPHKNKTVTVKQ
jgi:hypothetical protein